MISANKRLNLETGNPALESNQKVFFAGAGAAVPMRSRLCNAALCLIGASCTVADSKPKLARSLAALLTALLVKPLAKLMRRYLALVRAQSTLVLLRA